MGFSWIIFDRSSSPIVGDIERMGEMRTARRGRVSWRFYLPKYIVLRYLGT